MLWCKGRRSGNVIDAWDEGDASGGGGTHIGGEGPSLGGVAIAVIVDLLMGQDPIQIPGSLLGQMDSPAPATQQQVGGWTPAVNDEQSESVRSILGDTEGTWEQIFISGQIQHQQPKLVLFSNGVDSARGFASSATGPFCRPADRRVCLDPKFLHEMEQRFSVAGDFAQAYVIAHEVGHYMQSLMGIPAKINAARQCGTHMKGANDLLVRQELQAGCFAGAWANRAQQRLNWLEPGDIEEALNAANAISGDRLQRQGRGMMVSDPFTHDSLAQRMRWFKTDFENGSPANCDTFKAQTL